MTKVWKMAKNYLKDVEEEIIKNVNDMGINKRIWRNLTIKRGLRNKSL